MADRSRRQANSSNDKEKDDYEQLTIYSLKKLLISLQTSLNDHKLDIQKRLDDQKSSMKKQFQSQTTAIRDLETRLTNNIKSEIQSLQTYIDQEVSVLVRRFEQVENKLLSLEERQNQAEMYHYDTTIVVTNLPYQPDENLSQKVDTLINCGLGVNDAPVIRSTRLISRTNKPGLVKVQFRTLDHKIKVLRSKGKLHESDQFKHVFIRSSKPHAERVAENNLKTLMNAIPELSRDYRMTGNGKLVRKTDNQAPQVRGHSSPFASSGASPYYPHLSYSPYSGPPSVYRQSPSH